jgi:hypothetical protein
MPPTHRILIRGDLVSPQDVGTGLENPHRNGVLMPVHPSGSAADSATARDYLGLKYGAAGATKVARDPLVSGILEPVRSGAAVAVPAPGMGATRAYRSDQRAGRHQAAARRGRRSGATGAHASHGPCRARGVRRRGRRGAQCGSCCGGGTTPFVEAAWMAAENVFIEAQRPWERAALILSGTTSLPHEPATEVVMATGPLSGQ